MARPYPPVRESDQRIDWTAVRMEKLCGRLTQPTTYRLGLFVADPTADGDEQPVSGRDPTPRKTPSAPGVLREGPVSAEASE
ncbi:hypothetical protein BX257_0594 [Streptomyces sp. 3212.3]|nr:hypothetical protein BX257_0594 [Streptomyces sp. 3212.3]